MVSELVPETADLRTIINTVKVEKLKNHQEDGEGTHHLGEDQTGD